MNRRLIFVMATVLASSAAIVVACSSGPNAGTEGGPCYGNGSCNAGLTCASNLCVNLSGDATTTDASVSDTGVSDAGVEADAVADGPIIPPWRPTSLSGLTVWLEGDVGLLSSDGGVPFADAGVATWADQSGNHHDFTPYNGQNASITSLHSAPCVRLAGLGMVTNLTLGKTPVLVEGVVVGDVDLELMPYLNNGYVFGVNVTAQPLFFAEISSGPNPLKATDTTDASTATPHVVAAVYDGNETITLRIDGVQVAQAIAGSPVITANVGNVNMYLGGSVVCEVVFVAGAPPPVDVTSLDTYLKAKYSL